MRILVASQTETEDTFSQRLNDHRWFGTFTENGPSEDSVSSDCFQRPGLSSVSGLIIQILKTLDTLHLARITLQCAGLIGLHGNVDSFTHHAFQHLVHRLLSPHVRSAASRRAQQKLQQHVKKVAQHSSGHICRSSNWPLATTCATNKLHVHSHNVQGAHYLGLW